KSPRKSGQRSPSSAPKGGHRTLSYQGTSWFRASPHMFDEGELILQESFVGIVAEHGFSSEILGVTGVIPRGVGHFGVASGLSHQPVLCTFCRSTPHPLGAFAMNLTRTSLIGL